ncbi:MAG TPA: MFS transporter [Symbiobacteriaceae bacterium]|nr:MFS transporter [Symbiobacteriaceae bacterium]
MSRWFPGLWRHQEFLKLWGGQTFSIFGSLVGRIALPFLVIYALNATSAQVAWIRVAEVAPGMLIGLLAGVWVDRLRRRPIMIWADLGRALLTATIPLALWFGHLTLLHVMIVGAIISILTVIFDVAYEAYLPTLVESNHVVEANSKLSATASVAEVTGFGIAGALYQLIGGALTLIIDAVSFVVSAVTLAWIRKPEPAPGNAPSEQESEGSILREAREGLTVLARNPLLLTLVGAGSLGSFFGGIMGTIYVLYISRDLQVSPAVQGVLYGMGGVSSFIGAALSQRVLRWLGLGPALVVTGLLGTIGIALVPAAFGPMWLILAFIVGQQLLNDGADTINAIHVTSLRMTVTPNEYLGRVNATWRVANWLFMLLGTVAAGVLGDRIGLRATFWLAIGVRLVSWLWLTLSPVRSMREMPAAPENEEVLAD